MNDDEESPDDTDGEPRSVRSRSASLGSDMGALLVQVGSVLSTFLGVALVVFGSYSAYSGAITVEQAAAFGVVAVAVVGGYRSLVSGSGARVDAASNAALFVLGAGAYVGGVVGGVGTAATVGQALLAIAVAYLVVRLV